MSEIVLPSFKEVMEPYRVTFDEQSPVQSLDSVRELAGGLGLYGVVVEGRERIIGFHNTIGDVSTITPARTFADRKPAFRNLDDNAKGLGVIFGNEPEALTALVQGYESKGEYRTSGIFLLDESISVADALDLRSKNQQALLTRVRGIYAHAKLKVLAKIISEETVVERAGRRYGDAPLGLIDIAPTKQRGIANYSSWFNLRDVEHDVERIATYELREAA